MLDSLTSEAWMYLMIGLIVAAVCYAWAADAILGHIGFGVIVTSVIAAGGGYGGLMATDWAINHQKIPYAYATPTTYGGGAIVCVSVLLFVLCFLKRFVVR